MKPWKQQRKESAHGDRFHVSPWHKIDRFLWCCCIPNSIKTPVNRYNTVIKPIPFSSGFIPCARAFVEYNSALKAYVFAFSVSCCHVKMWSIVRRVRAWDCMQNSINTPRIGTITAPIRHKKQRSPLFMVCGWTHYRAFKREIQREIFIMTAWSPRGGVYGGIIPLICVK